MAGRPGKTGPSCLRATTSLWLIAIYQDAFGRAVQIIKLSASKRPDKRRQPAQAKQQRDRDKEGNAAHRAHLFNRSALATTMIEDVDMEIAAISGVTIPASASGTARIL